MTGEPANVYATRGQPLTNGDVTFDGPLSTFTPQPLDTFDRAIVAARFADVDTRGAGSLPLGWWDRWRYRERCPPGTRLAAGRTAAGR